MKLHHRRALQRVQCRMFARVTASLTQSAVRRRERVGGVGLSFPLLQCYLLSCRFNHKEAGRRAVTLVSLDLATVCGRGASEKKSEEKPLRWSQMQQDQHLGSARQCLPLSLHLFLVLPPFISRSEFKARVSGRK